MPTCETCNIIANGMGWGSHLKAHRARQEKIVVRKADGVWEYDYSPREVASDVEIERQSNG